MRRLVLSLSLLLISLTILPVQIVAQTGTPEAVTGQMTLILIERVINITNIDGGEAGPSAGDLIIWGPNPLFDETNSTDTGATTQGVCTAIDGTGLCLAVETIVFADGSTIQMQGLESGGSLDSQSTIIGGSGIYLGASGIVLVDPSDDLSIWVKTFQIWL